MNEVIEESGYILLDQWTNILTTRVNNMTDQEKEELKEKLKILSEKFHNRLKKPILDNVYYPKYDDVYGEGVKWLNTL